MKKYNKRRIQVKAMTLLDHVLLTLLGKELWAKRVVDANKITASVGMDEHDEIEVVHLEYELRQHSGAHMQYWWKWSHSCTGNIEYFEGDTKTLLEYIDKHIPQTK